MAAQTDWTDPDFNPADFFTQMEQEAERNERRRERNKNQRRAVKLRGQRYKQQKKTEQRKGRTESERLAFQQRRYEGEGEERRARREGREAQYERSQTAREQQQAYRQRRDAERQAYREQQDRERAERREAAARTPQSFSGPSFSREGQGIGATMGGWSPDRAAVAKFIILVTALSAIGAAANDIVNKKPATVLPNGTKVPAHLQSLGGSFIAGVVALIVNEVYPAAGAVLGAGILTIIAIPNWTPLIEKGSPLWSSLSSPAKAKAAVGAGGKAVTYGPGRDIYGNLLPNDGIKRDQYGNVIPNDGVKRDQYGNPIP